MTYPMNNQGQPGTPYVAGQTYGQPQYAPPQYGPQEYGRPPQRPQKKKRSPVVTVLLVLAVIGFLGCGGVVIAVAAGGLGKDAGGSSSSARAKMNQPARDGKFEFTVSRLECGRPTVGEPPVAGKQAQGQFCLVWVSVKNIGKEAQLFHGGSQKAKGPGGETYSDDGTAELYANKGITDTFLNEVNPGNAAVGVLVFDIPKGASIVAVELHDSPFSGGVTVDVSAG